MFANGTDSPTLSLTRYKVEILVIVKPLGLLRFFLEAMNSALGVSQTPTQSGSHNKWPKSN